MAFICVGVCMSKLCYMADIAAPLVCNVRHALGGIQPASLFGRPNSAASMCISCQHRRIAVEVYFNYDANTVVNYGASCPVGSQGAGSGRIVQTF